MVITFRRFGKRNLNVGKEVRLYVAYNPKKTEDLICIAVEACSNGQLICHATAHTVKCNVFAVPHSISSHIK
jgi:hypothetical protein